MKTKTSITSFALALLITGAVDGVSNLPSIALFGQQLVFFFIVASISFLLPNGLISAELCAQHKDSGGIYMWNKAALGKGFGALSIWLQWINTMIWFPTCLTTLLGTSAYIIYPPLAHKPLYLVFASLSAFWIMTIINLKGVKFSSKLASLFTLFGMLIPMVTIIVLCIAWLILKKPLALHLNHSAILPALNKSSSWTSLTAIITSFLGMELATVHMRKVKNAHKKFPKALFIAVIIIILTMGVGSLLVALVIPHKEIVLVTGTIQIFQNLFNGFHAPWLGKLLGAMLILGSLGAMVNWLISPANGLAQAAHDNYLPTSLAKENKHGAPKKILIIQGIVVSFVSLAFFLMPSINGSYWLLLDLSTELYVLMYVLMFIAAIKFFLNTKETKIIPGGQKVALAVSLLGFSTCLLTLFVGFLPPSNINTGGEEHFFIMFTSGFTIMLIPAIFLLAWKKYNSVKYYEKHAETY